MHTFFHTTFGFCLWDLLALIVLILMIVVLVLHIRKQRKREKEFEDELSEKLAEEAVANEEGLGEGDNPLGDMAGEVLQEAAEKVVTP